MMPGIEIDTLNFDFGSAEVRPEEIDKLDAIGRGDRAHRR
jgi:outer membrane protein OmpA-like peptidoglycan-associated protein